jgi:Right handed beta helix region
LKILLTQLAFDQGAIRMYTPGYFPPSMTTFDGLKIYRNNASGIFIHRCQNIRVDNSLFADNNLGIDIDRAEGIEVSNTKIIGLSPSYTALQARQPTVQAVCKRNERKGIDLHTWQKEANWHGAKITNVDISGFAASDTTCAKKYSITYDDMVRKQLSCCLSEQETYRQFLIPSRTIFRFHHTDT